MSKNIFKPGDRVRHPRFGRGVYLEDATHPHTDLPDYAWVHFGQHKRHVAANHLEPLEDEKGGSEPVNKDSSLAAVAFEAKELIDQLYRAIREAHMTTAADGAAAERGDGGGEMEGGHTQNAKMSDAKMSDAEMSDGGGGSGSDDGSDDGGDGDGSGDSGGGTQNPHSGDVGSASASGDSDDAKGGSADQNPHHRGVSGSGSSGNRGGSGEGGGQLSGNRYWYTATCVRLHPRRGEVIEFGPFSWVDMEEGGFRVSIDEHCPDELVRPGVVNGVLIPMSGEYLVWQGEEYLVDVVTKQFKGDGDVKLFHRKDLAPAEAEPEAPKAAFKVRDRVRDKTWHVPGEVQSVGTFGDQFLVQWDPEWAKASWISESDLEPLDEGEEPWFFMGDEVVVKEGGHRGRVVCNSCEPPMRYKVELDMGLKARYAGHELAPPRVEGPMGKEPSNG